MELLKNFGFDPYLFVAQIVNFLIVFYILKRYVYKPLLQVLKDRQQTIQRGITQAHESRLLFEKAQKEEKTILKNAQSQSKRLIQDAQKQASEILKQAEAATKQQTDKLIQDARTQIAKEAEIAENRVMGYISKISVEILERALSGLVNERAQEEILTKAIKHLNTKSN